ncbi:MAG: hypothetical protein ACE5IJ_10880 [Thermoplasmata archaeon]
MLKMLYYDMALFVDEEGRNPFPLLQESARMELTMLKREGRRN